MNPWTEALIRSAPVVGLPKICNTTRSILEWCYRLQALYLLDISFIETNTVEGPVDLGIPFREVKRHTGLTVYPSSWKPKSQVVFDREIRALWMEKIKEAALIQFKSPDEGDEMEQIHSDQ